MSARIDPRIDPRIDTELPPRDQWIPLRAAAAIANVRTRTLRRSLARINQDSPGVLRRFGSRGHWWVHVVALADLVARSCNPTDQIQELKTDQREMRNHLDSLRDSHFALRRKVARLEGRQTTKTTTDAPLSV